MHKISFKAIWLVGKTEYIKWAANPRMIILLVMLIFIYNFAIEPLLAHSKELNSPLNIFEPFIAITNSKMLMLIIPAVFIALVADFPKNDGLLFFTIQRAGRLNWFYGQLLFILFAVTSYILVVFLWSVIPVWKDGFIANGWSFVATRYASYFPNKSASFACELLPPNLYNQVSPYDALFVSLTTNIIYLCILSAILLLFHNLKYKTCGLIISSFIEAAGGALCILDTDLMWIMPLPHTVLWLHYTEELRKPVFQQIFSYIYLITLLFVLLVICHLTISKISIDSLQETD